MDNIPKQDTDPNKILNEEREKMIKWIWLFHDTVNNRVNKKNK